ncbi:hypothetical protein AcV5_003306 [Taiwanofungus camphoratus]|nr:hypothetical protein AcV5_003306 [Antrodia cinnamomea]
MGLKLPRTQGTSELSVYSLSALNIVLSSCSYCLSPFAVIYTLISGIASLCLLCKCPEKRTPKLESLASHFKRNQFNGRSPACLRCSRSSHDAASYAIAELFSGHIATGMIALVSFRVAAILRLSRCSSNLQLVGLAKLQISRWDALCSECRTFDQGLTLTD